MLRKLPERPVICDIGSRDALEGIYLFEQLRGTCLHVFEPNPIAADICRKNLEQVADGGVYFKEVAIADEIGELQFYPVNPALSDNKDIGFSSLFRINPDYTKRRGRIIQDKVIVTTTTLDEYFTGKQQPDLLWIDVEGAELKVPFRCRRRAPWSKSYTCRGFFSTDADGKTTVLGNS